MNLNGPPLHAELIARHNATRIGACVLMAFRTLRDAYSLDARPIVAMARYKAGGAIDPIAAFRESGWRREKASVRKPTSRAAGIV
jgi:L-rhamnose isomerase/sugar isomerase